MVGLIVGEMLGELVGDEVGYDVDGVRVGGLVGEHDTFAQVAGQ